VIDFKSWYTKAFGGHSPWGDEDSPALVTEVETALERELSQHIMKGGASPKISKVDKGKTLVEQGDHGHELFLLLDGVLGVEVGGEKLVDLGPGAVLGERALIGGGARTATLARRHALPRRGRDRRPDRSRQAGRARRRPSPRGEGRASHRLTRIR